MSVLGKWTGVIAMGSVGTYYRRFTIEDLVFYIQANRVALKMRKELYEELLTKDLQFHSKYTPGELTHILSTDIWQISNSLTFEASSAMRGAAFFLGGVGYLVYASPHLTAVSLMPMLVMAGLSK
jgi:ABC-type multidrug transport system fused ATPase/permease subunit